MFFSFDGIDGVGKTTQMDLFCEWLHQQDYTIVTCRDPGSTLLGEQLREIVLAKDDSTPIAPTSEMLLYMAARAQLVEEVIRPALEAGSTVVSDRFLLANIVYQGYAGGLDVESVRDVGNIATGGLQPNCTFLLDMAPDAARARMGADLDRMENRGDAYRERLRAGFLKEAHNMKGSVHVVEADRPVEQVQSELRELASGLLE